MIQNLKRGNVLQNVIRANSDKVESTRDFGWDKDGLMTCYKCNGTQEIKTTRKDFCCEGCIDEYFYKDQL